MFTEDLLLVSILLCLFGFKSDSKRSCCLRLLFFLSSLLRRGSDHLEAELSGLPDLLIESNVDECFTIGVRQADRDIS